MTIEEEKRSEVVPEIYELIGEANAMTGSAVSTALATTSWAEPLIVLLGLGVAILMNAEKMRSQLKQ